MGGFSLAGGEVGDAAEQDESAPELGAFAKALGQRIEGLANERRLEPLPLPPASPASSISCGSCVDLPEPVSPTRMTVSCARS